MDGKGFCFIELLSNCPTNWGMTPMDTLKWMAEHTLPEFPLGVYKDGGDAS
jgi:2-oxoglutarate ferredoxin oxidoreductase subunit beta